LGGERLAGRRYDPFRKARAALARRQQLLQELADYKRLSAMQAEVAQVKGERHDRNILA
jgi:membrane peptidoglycan carboxypeptidase